MGLLKGLLGARKLLLSILVPLLLLPLPMLHPSSVSIRSTGPGGGQAGEAVEGRGRLSIFSLFCCWFEEIEVFSWRRLNYFLPKNCHARPPISFPVPLRRTPEEGQLSGLMCHKSVAFLTQGGPCADKDTSPGGCQDLHVPIRRGEQLGCWTAFPGGH